MTISSIFVDFFLINIFLQHKMSESGMYSYVLSCSVLESLSGAVDGLSLSSLVLLLEN